MEVDFRRRPRSRPGARAGAPTVEGIALTEHYSPPIQVPLIALASEIRGRRPQPRLRHRRWGVLQDRIDRGTRELLKALTVRIRPGQRVLDLGCGYGPIGIVLGALEPDAHVTMVDINQRACDLARQNLAANGIANAEVVCGDFAEAVGERTFDVIVTNPPIRAGRSVLRSMIDWAHAHLAPGGELFLVVRTGRAPPHCGLHGCGLRQYRRAGEGRRLPGDQSVRRWRAVQSPGRKARGTAREPAACRNQPARRGIVSECRGRIRPSPDAGRQP